MNNQNKRLKPVSSLASSRWFLIFILGLALLYLHAIPQKSWAEVYIDINRGNVQPLPIALVNFSGDDDFSNQLGQNIKTVIEADLERSGLFAPINEAAFISKEIDIAVRPRFSDWRLINAQALVHGKIEQLDGDDIRVEFRLWDIFAETQMQGVSYRTKANNWRRIAHVIADSIYERVTGETGYFDSRIVYIAESGPGDARQKRLAIMDQDGANHRYLTDGRTLVLTPRFSPAQQEITYLSYFNGVPRVYIFNLQTGAQQVLGAFDGMTFAPRFSPDGRQLVMSYAQNGRSNIHLMNLETRQIRQLTNNSAIDTAPSFSPDGQQITFESDRGGSQEIYVMNSDGSGQKRISFGDGSYATPVWSPRGDLIAFTKILSGQFYIGVMRPDGSGERILVQGFHNEGPTWSPNGRVLLYFREFRNDKDEKISQIMSIDLTGQNQRRILTPTDASDPAWSPLNP